MLYACLDHPQRVFGGVYHFAEFGWNRCRSFNNMQVLIFNEFGLQMPIYASQMWIWGNLTPTIIATPKGTSLRRNTPLRSAHRCLHSSHNSNPMLYNAFQWARHPQNCPSRVEIWTLSNTYFLGSTRVRIQNGMSIGSAVFV